MLMDTNMTVMMSGIAKADTVPVTSAKPVNSVTSPR